MIDFARKGSDAGCRISGTTEQIAAAKKLIDEIKEKAKAQEEKAEAERAKAQEDATAAGRPVPRTPSSWVSTATPQALAGEIAATLRASDPVQFCEAYDVLVYCTAWTHF